MGISGSHIEPSQAGLGIIYQIAPKTKTARSLVRVELWQKAPSPAVLFVGVVGWVLGMRARGVSWISLLSLIIVSQ